MATRDPRIDAYIAQSAGFAKPILKHLRSLVHAGCPAVEETMKWSMPHFVHHGILCGMASFKAHCTFGFWKGELIKGKTPTGKEDEAMGQFGRITKLADLPPDDVLISYVNDAARLNEEGVKRPAPPKPKQKAPLVVPDYFAAALKKNRKALTTFESFSYSHKKEYLEWITEAKGEDTRKRRMETSIEWLSEGKPRNWKYARC